MYLLFHLLISNQQEYFGEGGKETPRFHLIARAISNIPLQFVQEMTFGSLALQAFLTYKTLLKVSNEYLYDIFLFRLPEETNLVDMERRVLALEQRLVRQIRYLRERLRADTTIDPGYKTSTSKICGYYFS
jgi:hypothetical protein